MRPSISNAGLATRALAVLFFFLEAFLSTGLMRAQNNVPGVAAASITADRAEDPITLEQAIQIALEKNPLHKVALADQKAATAGVKQAQSLLLPHIEFSESATRGNDPVYVFGTKLRQQRFTVADFALNQLNTDSDQQLQFSIRWRVEPVRFLRELEERISNAIHATASAAQLERTDQELVFAPSRLTTAFFSRRSS